MPASLAIDRATRSDDIEGRAWVLRGSRMRFLVRIHSKSGRVSQTIRSIPTLHPTAIIRSPRGIGTMRTIATIVLVRNAVPTLWIVTGFSLA